MMKLKDFRINVAMLSQPALSSLSKVSLSSIKRAEDGGKISPLTRARLIAGLSRHLGREIDASEIDEFKVISNSADVPKEIN